MPFTLAPGCTFNGHPIPNDELEVMQGQLNSVLKRFEPPIAHGVMQQTPEFERMVSESSKSKDRIVVAEKKTDASEDAHKKK